MPDDPNKPAPNERKPDLPLDTVTKVFVGALLLVVLSVIAEYVLGEFRGRNPGADFGLILAVTLIVAFCVGFLAAAIHRYRSRHH
jgi:hypothetical protein